MRRILAIAFAAQLVLGTSVGLKRDALSGNKLFGRTLNWILLGVRLVKLAWSICPGHYPGMRVKIVVAMNACLSCSSGHGAIKTDPSSLLVAGANTVVELMGPRPRRPRNAVRFALLSGLAEPCASVSGRIR